MANSSFAVDDAKLREELEKFDVNVGKITSKNREILVKKLNHLRARQRAAEAPPSPNRSPGRRSTGGRGGKRSPPRRSQAPPAAFHFSSSDDDDDSPAPGVTQRQKNLRRRTVDTRAMNGER